MKSPAARNGRHVQPVAPRDVAARERDDGCEIRPTDEPVGQFIVGRDREREELRALHERRQRRAGLAEMGIRALPTIDSQRESAYRDSLIPHSGRAIMGLKEAYVEKHEAQLRAWDAEIQKLEAKAAEANAEVKIVYYEQLQALYSKRDRAREELHALESAGTDAWESLKTGLEHAWDDLKTGMKRAVEKFQS